MAVGDLHRVVLRRLAAICVCVVVAHVVVNADASSAVYSAAGSTPSAIQPVVDAFRAALGADNGNLPGQQPDGRRSITWDDIALDPDPFRVTYFPNPMETLNSPPTTRGAVFSNGCQDSFCFSAGFVVSGVNGFYGEGPFIPFSGARLFGPGPLQAPVTEVRFFVAGTEIPATVSGFGVVFSDVDLATSTSVEFFNSRDESIGLIFAPPASQGLSFVGMIFADQRIARVRIVTGNTPLGIGNTDGPSVFPGFFNDIVAMDDVMYAEPSVFGPPTVRDDCRNDGWKRFDFPRTFRNQGDCIQYVNTGN